MTNEQAIRLANQAVAFLRTGTGKAAVGLFAAVFFVCFPQVPGYAVAAVALYYCVHQFRPVAYDIFQDLRHDLMEADHE